MMTGVGDAMIRSLSLLAEIIFQAPPSHRDPTGRTESVDPRGWADYSHAHGGKDGTPFPVCRDTYNRNVVVLSEAVRRARLGDTEKFDALRRLGRLGRSDV